MNMQWIIEELRVKFRGMSYEQYLAFKQRLDVIYDKEHKNKKKED